MNNRYKIIINLVILMLLFQSCKLYNIENKKQQEFKKHLTVVKGYLNVKNTNRTILMDTVIESVNYLENKTCIKSSVFQGFDSFPNPSRKDYRKWKRWFKNNINKF